MTTTAASSTISVLFVITEPGDNIERLRVRSVPCNNMSVALVDDARVVVVAVATAVFPYTIALHV